jgi:hypothetical protein
VSILAAEDGKPAPKGISQGNLLKTNYFSLFLF